MWHEARKQERRIRGLIVDYRRRAERRQDFYEKIVSWKFVDLISIWHIWSYWLCFTWNCSRLIQLNLYRFMEEDAKFTWTRQWHRPEMEPQSCKWYWIYKFIHFISYISGFSTFCTRGCFRFAILLILYYLEDVCKLVKEFLHKTLNS